MMKHFMLMDIHTKEKIEKLAQKFHPIMAGGGVLIYLIEGLDYVRRNDIETSDVESIWIEVKIRQSNSFLVCSAYFPPSSPTLRMDR